ncbi:meiosis-specific nuclear structural protein 1 [Drosophila biarmipes]|uniref:meiosis-specific nuclear structural protein 1 n=1 Tax=Drosophila biarmipes TaxID=125945 RepID=UPI0007E887D6|nr:meiosis-specific nuclear structural protein 1 [Drosophila biarmipes]
MHGHTLESERPVPGLWDNPGVAIFATSAQEPIPNMLTHLKPMPVGDECVSDKDACRLLSQTSVAENTLYRQVKHQVEEVAAQRNTYMHPRQGQEQKDADITLGLAAELARQQVEASRCRQLHRNVENLRDLEMEVARAHTALSVKNKIINNIKQTVEDKQRERTEALAKQRAIEQEEQEEKRQRAQKAAAFRKDLMNQITEARNKRLKDQREAIEEGRKELKECKDKVEQDNLRDAMHKVEQRRVLLESLDQSAAMLKQTREAYALAQKNKPERGVLDALGPVTAAYVAKAQKRHREEIEARDINAARLGFQLSQIKHDLESRDQLITSLLIREFKAKENAKALEQARNKRVKKQEIREQLLSQREEQKFFREKAVQDALIKAKDPMCFGERQYRMQVAQKENTRRLDVQCYQDMALMVEEAKKRRLADAQEVEDILQELRNVQERQDAFVAAERMKLLAQQPNEVLSALKKSILTEEEINTFSLKK